MIFSADILGINGFRNGIHHLEWSRFEWIHVWICTKFDLYSFERVL